MKLLRKIKKIGEGFKPSPTGNKNNAMAAMGSDQVNLLIYLNKCLKRGLL